MIRLQIYIGIMLMSLAFGAGVGVGVYNTEKKFGTTVRGLKAEASKKYCQGEITYPEMTGGK